MAETRKYTRAGRRNIIDATRLVSQDGEYNLVCAPKGAFDIARHFLGQRGLWRTSYAVGYGDTEYTLPDDATMDVIAQQINEFLEATSIMNCDDLVTGIDAIVDAINAGAASGGCGCGSSGAGPSSPDIETTDTGDVTSGTGTPPVGYPDWETYQQTKCDIASWIVANLAADINWLSHVGVDTLSVLGLGLGLSSLISGTVSIILLSALVALHGYASSALEDIYQGVQSGVEDLVCAIMGGETTQGSIDAFLTELDGIIDAAVSDTIARFAAKQALHYFADTTQFNLLYAPYAAVENLAVPTGADCEACGLDCTNIQLYAGIYYGAGQYASQLNSGHERIEGNYNADGPGADASCGEHQTQTFDAIVGHTGSGAGANDFRIWEGDADGTLVLVYDSDTPPIGQTFCIRRFSYLSATPYSLYLTDGGKCTP